MRFAPAPSRNLVGMRLEEHRLEQWTSGVEEVEPVGAALLSLPWPCQDQLGVSSTSPGIIESRSPLTVVVRPGSSMRISARWGCGGAERGLARLDHLIGRDQGARWRSRPSGF